MHNAFLSHADAALRNRNSVLHYVRYHEKISRTDIWEDMNISRASVTQLIRQLQESNLIQETGEGESTGGRKPRFIMFNGEAKKLYAFDWSCRSLYLTDLNGSILYEKKMNFPQQVSATEFAALILGAIDHIDALKLCPEEEIIGFGMALPGLINSRTCTVIYSVELGWQNVNLSNLFICRFGANIYLERMGNAMALGAYYHGPDKGTNHFQLFILGNDGIGMSTIVHGDCQHGAGCMHGELGHIKVQGQIPCSCGQKGCLEAVVAKLLADSQNQITDEIIDFLAMGVSTAINISDPDAIILVGSLVEKMDSEQRKQLGISIREKVTGSQMRQLNIRFSNETKELALNGIVEYVFDRYFAIN